MDQRVRDMENSAPTERAAVTTCTCERYTLVAPDGTVLEGERVRDPDCREHGFPTDKWPKGHPLYRHRKVIDTTDGAALTDAEAKARISDTQGPVTRWPRFREETPRETEARLYQESLR